jgi:hypothetical protein
MEYGVNWEAISAIGQIVGAIAVVISLIYLAREIRSKCTFSATGFCGYHQSVARATRNESAFS